MYVALYTWTKHWINLLSALYKFFQCQDALQLGPCWERLCSAGERETPPPRASVPWLPPASSCTTSCSSVYRDYFHHITCTRLLELGTPTAQHKHSPLATMKCTEWIDQYSSVNPLLCLTVQAPVKNIQDLMVYRPQTRLEKTIIAHLSYAQMSITRVDLDVSVPSSTNFWRTTDPSSTHIDAYGNESNAMKLE